MKKTILLLVIVSILSCNRKSEKVTLSKELNSIAHNLDDYFTALTNLNQFNGVVLAFKNDSLVLEKAYNINPERESSTHVTIHSQFDIHSVAKLMAHYLIVNLSERKKISENQTIDRFYPNFPNGDKITVKMLLNHSSGLPREFIDFEGNEFELGPNEIVGLAHKQELLFEPGQDVQYSNVGYELIYDIISHVYGKSFTQCVTDEIFVPLNMDHSGAHFFTKNNRITNLAKNHTLKDSSLIQVPNILEDEFKTARLFSTARDLNLFLNRVKEEPYASSLQNESGVIAKDGGSKGIRAQVYMDLINDFSFVLLANYDEMPFFKTIEDVVKILKSEPFEIPEELNRKSIELKKEVLERYIGSYSFADFDGLVLTVKVEGNNLVVFQENEKIAELKAETETVFFENPRAPESFEFIPNESGTYDALMGWKGITVEGKRQ